MSTCVEEGGLDKEEEDPRGGVNGCGSGRPVSSSVRPECSKEEERVEGGLEEEEGTKSVNGLGRPRRVI